MKKGSKREAAILLAFGFTCLGYALAQLGVVQGCLAHVRYLASVFLG